jgi:choline dehydrogenase-like flavoprotein
MDRSYVPAAIEHGARFFTSCRVDELIVEGGRVAGARASVMGPDGQRRIGRVEVRAKATILSAGTLASPVVLLKSDLPYKSPAIGTNLCFHNGIAVAGVFDQDIEPWFGATQSFDCDAYLREGIHMENLWSPSALMISRTRGFGEALRKALNDLRRTNYWCIAVRGTSRGRVAAGRGTEPRLSFDLNEHDVGLLKRGLDLLVDHFFAAGAVRVKPGILGFDAEIRTPEQVAALKRLKPRAGQFVVGGNHAYGATPMGADPARSVVGSDHAVHGVADLYVCDTGVFPTQTAVNPQLTLMALSSRLASILRERY